MLLLRITKSSLPSALKSPTARAVGANETATLAGVAISVPGAKEMGPAAGVVLIRTVTPRASGLVLLPLWATIRSWACLPLPVLNRPAATAVGDWPTAKVL